VAIVSTAAGFWFFSTQRNTGDFALCLHRTGIEAIVVDGLMLAGAWSGNRVESISYLRPTRARRIRNDQKRLRRAFSDLNVLALTGLTGLTAVIVAHVIGG